MTGIKFPAGEAIPLHPAYRQDQTWRPVVPAQAGNFRLADLSWRKLSYTFLAAHQPYLPHLAGTAADDAYGQFIFRQLPRGAATGNFLHDVFERIDFRNEETWLPLLEKMAPRYLPGYTADQLPQLNTLIGHTLHADIRVGGGPFASAAWADPSGSVNSNLISLSGSFIVRRYKRCLVRATRS